MHELLELGALWAHTRNGQGATVLARIASATQVVQEGCYLRAYLRPRRFPLPAGNTDPCHWVVADTAALVVLDKPAGVPSVARNDNAAEAALPLIAAALTPKIAEGGPSTPTVQLWPTGRLDVGTSGLLVLGRSRKAAAEYNRLLRAGLVHKTYRAVVRRRSADVAPLPPPGSSVIHWMSKMAASPQTIADLADSVHPLECHLVLVNVRLVDHADGVAIVNLDLKTGRTHQIRAQLSHLGWPLVGDVLYGGHAGDTVDPHQPVVNLRCTELSFQWDDHPRTHRLE